MLRKAGSWIGTIKKYISNVQNEVADLDLDNINPEKPKIKDKEKDNDKT